MTYYKGDAATRIDDILVSAFLVRANIVGDYLEMRKEDTPSAGRTAGWSSFTLTRRRS